MSNEKILFIRRLGLIGITNLVNHIIGVILIPLFTKGRPIEDYGVWVQITATLGLVPLVISFGLPYLPMVRYIAGEKDKKRCKEILYSIWIFVLFSSIFLGFPITYVIIKYLIKGYFHLFKLLYMLLVLNSLVNVGLNYFRAIQKVTLYSLFMTLQTILKASGLIYALLNNWDIYNIVLTQVIAMGLICFIVGIYVVKDIGIYLPEFKYIPNLLKFSIPLLPSVLSSWIVSSSDRYLIGYYLGVKYVGYYNPAYSLGSLLNFVIAPLAVLLPATLSKLYEAGKIREVKVYLQCLLNYYIVIAIPAVFGISVLAEPVLIMLSTQEIAENSYLIVPFVATSIMFFGIYVIVYQVLLLKKRTEVIGKIWGISAVLNFLLNIVFIPQLGILGAAVTTLVAYVFASIATLRYSINLVNLEFGIEVLLKSLISALMMVGAVSYLRANGVSSLLSIITVGAMVYIVCLFLLRTFKKGELYYLLTLFK